MRERVRRERNSQQQPHTKRLHLCSQWLAVSIPSPGDTAQETALLGNTVGFSHSLSCSLSSLDTLQLFGGGRAVCANSQVIGRSVAGPGGLIWSQRQQPKLLERVERVYDDRVARHCTVVDVCDCDSRLFFSSALLPSNRLASPALMPPLTCTQILASALQRSSSRGVASAFQHRSVFSAAAATSKAKHFFFIPRFSPITAAAAVLPPSRRDLHHSSVRCTERDSKASLVDCL